MIDDYKGKNTISKNINSQNQLLTSTQKNFNFISPFLTFFDKVRTSGVSKFYKKFMNEDIRNFFEIFHLVRNEFRKNNLQMIIKNPEILSSLMLQIQLKANYSEIEQFTENQVVEIVSNFFNNIFIKKNLKEIVILDECLTTHYNFSNLGICENYQIINQNSFINTNISNFIFLAIKFERQNSKHYCYDLSLDFSFNKIKSIGAHEFKNLIKNDDYYKLKLLNFASCNLGNEGIHIISKYLKYSSYISDIILASNDISDDGILFLTESLLKNQSLKAIDLSDNSITNKSGKYLAKLIEYNFTLSSVNLSNNKITQEGAKFIFEAFRNNPLSKISSLNFGNNRIGTDGIRNLSEFLKIGFLSSDNFEILSTMRQDENKFNSLTSINSLNINSCNINTKCTQSTIQEQMLFKDTNDISLPNFFNNNTSLSMNENTMLIEHKFINVKNESINIPIFDNKNRNFKKEDIKMIEDTNFIIEQSKTLINPFNVTQLDLLSNKSVCRLIYLNLCNNKVTDFDIHFLSNSLRLNYNLEVLNLSHNKLTQYSCKAITEALIQNNRTNIQSLIISNNEIENRGFKYLGNLLKKNCTIKTLNLAFNKITGEDLEVISEALSINKSLTDFQLQYNELGDIGCYYLAKGMKCNSTLEKLNLFSNKIEGKGAKYLSQAIISNKISAISTLFLGCNNIGNKGVFDLCSLFSINIGREECRSSLQVLDISQNKIGSKATKILARTILENNSLLILDLKENEFQLQDIKIILDAFSKNQIIQKLNLNSNIPKFNLNDQNSIECSNLIFIKEASELAK